MNAIWLSRALERADQFSRPWDIVIVQPDQRTMLARTILLTGLQPLTKSLLTDALRRYSDAGAEFVLEVVSGASEQLQRSPSAKQAAKLLALGVNAFRNATLTSLHGRRLTATVFSQAALVDDVLSELTAIANIQAARRESGLSLRKGDPSVLRQVKRPTADADVDFQVYTMSESVRNMPLRQMPREDRIELSNRLALLGTQSDGWTAAGAASTLVDLGAIKFAVEVVEKIPANDPTRAEGFISLVRGLLEVEEPELADEQVQLGLEWARTYPGRNPERALIWGLAESYLERKQPEKALALLDTWKEPAGFFRQLGRIFSPSMSDDELRNSGLRLRALLMDERSDPRDIQNLVARLRTWAPRLLDGEALVNFLLENMIGPLLESGRTEPGYDALAGSPGGAAPWQRREACHACERCRESALAGISAACGAGGRYN